MIYYRNEKATVVVNVGRLAEIYLNGVRVMGELPNGRKIPLYMGETEEEAKEVFEKIVSGISASISDTLIRVGGNW